MPKKYNAPARVPDCHPERKHLARGLCKPCYDVDYAQHNREARNAKARQWAARNPERRLAIKRKSLYGIDAATVQARLNAQDDLCKICGAAPAAHLDHDHATGKPRGLLCGDCNRGLGLFRDDPERLARAVTYLGLWRIPNTGQRADGQP